MPLDAKPRPARCPRRRPGRLPSRGLESRAARPYGSAEEGTTMLADKQPIATVAVKDLDVARKFYEGVLGLTVVNAQGSEAITFGGGGSTMIVYRSQYAGTNKATVVNWMVGGQIE